jgi:hypothetical protein
MNPSDNFNQHSQGSFDGLGSEDHTLTGISPQPTTPGLYDQINSQDSFRRSSSDGPMPHIIAHQDPPSNTSTPPMYQNPYPESQYSQSASVSSSGQHTPASSYQENGRAETKKSSVVIKVGMVGDAQIGKTSLMVKYVEGNWDEDYIQTLGMLVDNYIC